MPLYLGSVWILTCERSRLQGGVGAGDLEGSLVSGAFGRPVEAWLLPYLHRVQGVAHSNTADTWKEVQGSR